MQKCFIYCRKSSEDSARQVQSIDDQKRVISELALNHSLVVERIFMDEKSAGAPGKREGYRKMIRAIHKGKGGIILAWKIDRLSRNPIENGEISWLLQNGIIQKIITPDKTYLPEDNVLPFMVEGAMANQYLRDLSRNVKRGMQGKVQRGVYPSKAPFGYINTDGERGERIIGIDPVIYPKLEILWGYLIQEQCQLSDLYRIMKTKYPIYDRFHKVIAKSTFHRIFKNNFYCGLFTWKEETYTGTHQKMLSISEFKKVQDFLENKPKTRVVNHEFDYRGLFSCGDCGSAITAENKRKFIKSKGITKGYEYYKCPRHKRCSPCQQKPIAKHLIEVKLMNLLTKLKFPAPLVKHGIEFLTEKLNGDSTSKRRQLNVNKEICSLKKDIATISNNIVLETDSEIRALMKSKMQQCRIDVVQLEEEHADFDRKSKRILNNLKNQSELFQNAFLILKEGLKEDKQKLIHSVGTNWAIKDGELSFQPHILCNAITLYKQKSGSFKGSFEPSKTSPDDACNSFYLDVDTLADLKYHDKELFANILWQLFISSK